MSTLGFERGTAGMLENIRYGAVVERLVDMARQRLGASALENDDIGQRLAQLRAEVTAVRAMTYRIASRAAIAPPGSAAPLARAFFSQARKRVVKEKRVQLRFDPGASRLLKKKTHPK